MLLKKSISETLRVALGVVTAIPESPSLVVLALLSSTELVVVVSVSETTEDSVVISAEVVVFVAVVVIAMRGVLEFLTVGVYIRNKTNPANTHSYNILISKIFKQFGSFKMASGHVQIILLQGPLFFIPKYEDRNHNKIFDKFIIQIISTKLRILNKIATEK